MSWMGTVHPSATKSTTHFIEIVDNDADSLIFFDSRSMKKASEEYV